MANLVDAGSECPGRFTYGEILAYLTEGRYPDSYLKADKQALRKRAKFFLVKDAHLYYIGGELGPLTDSGSVNDIIILI